MNDKEKYLQELRDRVEEQRAVNERERSVFRQTDDSGELKRALRAMSSLDDPELYEKARLIAADPSQDAELRVLALTKLRGGILDHGAMQETALEILVDQQDDAVVRMTALNTLQAEAFSSDKFSENKAEFMSSLRQVLGDSNADLRARAAEQLAFEKDEFVQRKLLEEVETGDAFLVNRAKAIQLLGYDLHAEYYPVLRRVVQEEKASVTEKNEAILALANDTNSKELLEDITTDKAMPNELRISGANSLRAQDPYTFETIAKKIVVDEKEDNEMRVLCLNNLLQQSNSERLQEDDGFWDQLRRIKGVRRSPELKKLSRQYLDKTKRGQKGN